MQCCSFIFLPLFSCHNPQRCPVSYHYTTRLIRPITLWHAGVFFHSAGLPCFCLSRINSQTNPQQLVLLKILLPVFSPLSFALSSPPPSLCLSRVHHLAHSSVPDSSGCCFILGVHCVVAAPPAVRLLCLVLLEGGSSWSVEPPPPPPPYDACRVTWETFTMLLCSNFSCLIYDVRHGSPFHMQFTFPLKKNI